MSNYSYYNDRIMWPVDVVQNKKRNAEYYARYMLARISEMFEYDGLPDTIIKRNMLLQLFTNGNIFVAQKPGTTDLYSFTGGWGGEPNAYYVPTIYTVSNPYLDFSANFRIGEDGILIYNDSMAQGLLPIIMRYSELLAENDVSLRMATINSRRRSLISAPDDPTKLAADKYLQDVEEGRLGSVAENAFLDGIRVQADGSSPGLMTDLIELEQYLKASLYNELGLNANYNMKREAINSNESQLNKDALYPLIDNMLAEQTIGWNAVNDMFGTDIRVRLSSSWKDNEEEKAADLSILENEADTSEKAENRPESEESDEETV